MSAEHLFDRPKVSVETRVSSYDRVNSWLVSALLMIGCCVGLLFMLWLTSVIKFTKRPVQLIVIEETEGEDKPKGEADDVLEPGVEEFPDVETPQLKDALEAVTSAISTVRADMEARDGSATEQGRGRGLGSKDGGGGGGGGIVPEYKRWRIEYEASDVGTYSRQLSFFKIDVGAVHQLNNNITRLADPGGAPRVVRSNRQAEAKAVHFGHANQRLQRWDTQLLKNANVDTEQCLIRQFYPDQTRASLRQLERDYLASARRELKEVRNTFFKIVPAGNGFEFKITNQTYRQ